MNSRAGVPGIAARSHWKSRAQPFLIPPRGACHNPRAGGSGYPPPKLALRQTARGVEGSARTPAR
eukprot:313495-Pelagomonas_calceolata.AAC.1